MVVKKKGKSLRIGKRGAFGCGRYGGKPFLIKSTNSGNNTKSDGESDSKYL